MKQTAKTLFIAYALVLFVDLLFLLWRQDNLRWFSKPLLMPVLMVAFYLQAPQKNGRLFFLILSALFFSWCGDVLLQAKNLFIPGLLSFLVAHVAYIFYFRKAGKSGRGLLRKRPWLVVPVLLYVVLLLAFLFPRLGQLKIPVVVYSLTIGTMLLMAVDSRLRLPPSAAAFFTAGALLFVLSDSLLAMNLFAVRNPSLGPFVMMTYAAAQFAIVRGALIPVEGTLMQTGKELSGEKEPAIR